ncbi:MAG: hypothetical protein JWL77_4984, partial [Chthonomonadaceae bacterium]|nr:hypothetical protein [Chthonomonadaceae bacterium]
MRLPFPPSNQAALRRREDEEPYQNGNNRRSGHDGSHQNRRGEVQVGRTAVVCKARLRPQVETYRQDQEAQTRPGRQHEAWYVQLVMHERIRLFLFRKKIGMAGATGRAESTVENMGGSDR